MTSPDSPPGPAPGPAPVDPRTDLPPFGGLPVVASLAPWLHRVIAPNPSPLTLDGTNTYVVAEPGVGSALVVDPGPPPTDEGGRAHLERVAGLVAELDVEVAGIVVTHHHLDHSEAAAAWAEHFGCRVHAPTAAVAGHDGVVVRNGDEVGPAGARLVAVATPGHCADHLAYRSGDGSILVGDHVLGRGTSVVAYPDGDLLAYLDSLERVLDLGPHALWPGHGPELVDDPGAVLRYYAEHRAHRERQVVDVLARRGVATPREVVEVVYAAYPEAVWDAAEASTRAALAKLEAEGAVDLRTDGDRLEARLVPVADARAPEADAASAHGSGSLRRVGGADTTNGDDADRGADE